MTIEELLKTGDFVIMNKYWTRLYYDKRKKVFIVRRESFDYDYEVKTADKAVNLFAEITRNKGK